VLTLLLGALVACRPPSPGVHDIRAVARGSMPPGRWGLPKTDPCAVLPRTVIESLAGATVQSPEPGGATIDGSACRFTGSEERFVITMGLISTNAYESLRLDFGGDRVSGVGDEALVDGPDQLGDVTLVARAGDAAVMVMVSGNMRGTVGPARRRLAADIARRALERLNPATAGIRPKPGGPESSRAIDHRSPVTYIPWLQRRPRL
jgi:hypothetical protein